MKMNNKGFMMAEVVVVSAIVLVALTSLYASYSKIYSLYRTRLNYNDVQTFYRLTYYRDCLKNGSELFTDGSSKNISIDSVKVDDDENTSIYLFNGSIDLGIDGINDSYKDYLRYLNSIMENKADINYILTMEKCDSDKDNCKYAYIEIKDEG